MERRLSRFSRTGAVALVAFVLVLLLGASGYAGSEYYPTQTNGYAIYLSPANHANVGCDGYIESEGAFRLATAVKDWLLNIRYMVKIGDGDRFHNSDESNAWGSDLHAPIHSNAPGTAWDCNDTDPVHGGTVLLYGDEADYAPSAKILNRMKDYSPGTSDQIVFDQLTELNRTTMPAAYVEAAFHTFKPDKDWLVQSAAVADRIARGIDDYFGNPRCGVNIICILSADQTSVVPNATSGPTARASTDYRKRLGGRSFPALKNALSEQIADPSDPRVPVNEVVLAGGDVIVDLAEFATVLAVPSTNAAKRELLAKLGAVVFSFPVAGSVVYQVDGTCEAFYGRFESECAPMSRSEWIGLMDQGPATVEHKRTPLRDGVAKP